jgi:hypothetical protein
MFDVSDYLLKYNIQLTHISILYTNLCVRKSIL